MTRSDRHSEYLSESARPLTSLVYVLPILAIYEVGALWLGPAAIRNGADVWLRQLLDQIGFGQYFLLPLLTCGLLVGWHHVRRDRWRLSSDTLGAMLSETTLFALLLAGIGFLQNYLVQRYGLSLASTADHSMASGSASRLVGYMGAGIYEEVLFRLLIIPVVAKFLQVLGEPKSVSLAGAAVASSMLFAAAHYELFTRVGEPLDVASFSFRFVAGLVFAAIFIYRGFGIAAGAHALYDILVGVLSA